MAAALPIYVINRARDSERLARFQAAAPADVTRIEALDGHDPDAPLFLYRDLIADRFWGGEDIKPGAFGCFVSHMNAWLRMLGEGYEAALICEDDIDLNREFTSDLKRLAAQARRHGDYDLIFANDRMTGWRDVVSQRSDTRLLPVQTIVARMQAAGARPGDGDLARGPGADAYVISARGAAAMLAACRKAGVVAGVDWFMLAHGLQQPDTSETDWEETAFLGPLVETSLTVLATDRPLGARSEMPSSIAHKITVPISRFRDVGSLVRVEKTPQRQPAGAPLMFPKGPAEDPVFVTLGEGHLPEEPALALTARWMPPGGVFVDIGAHVGVHSLFMLRHGGAGQAVPLECNKRVIPLLRAAAEANNLEDRFTFDNLGIAAGAERGKKELTGPKRAFSAARLREGFVEDIRVRPTAALLRDVDPDMVKIDVNGEERDVLKGLRKILKQRRPVLAIDLTRPKSNKVFPFLGRMGYREAERAEWTAWENHQQVAKSFAVFIAEKPGQSAGPKAEDS